MSLGDVYTQMECDGCHRLEMLSGDGEWGETHLLESNDWTSDYPRRYCPTCSAWRAVIADLLYVARRLRGACFDPLDDCDPNHYKVDARALSAFDAAIKTFKENDE